LAAAFKRGGAQKLAHLDLNDCDIGDVGAQALVDVARAGNLPTLQELSGSQHSISDDTMLAVEAAIKDLKPQNCMHVN
jgi:Ran GTPase-activating protein (RanGAP) involved in mRNA processing and transport